VSVLRVGIVGAGRMGRVHGTAFSELAGSEVVWVCDTDAARARQLADDLGIPRATTDASELVPAEDIDAVVVATPFDAHFGPTVAALRAGKHVLVEKPLATTPEEAHAMAEEAARVGRVLTTGFNLRYEPRYRMVKDWLAAEDRGRIVSMFLSRVRPEQEPLTSDIAFENTSHDVDVALWLSGQRVERVFALQSRRSPSERPRGFWALARLEAGTVVNFEVAWLVPSAARIERGDQLELIAEGGIAKIDVSDPGIVFWQPDGRASRDPILDPNSITSISLAYRSEVEDFVRVVGGDTSRCQASLPDAVHAVEVVAAMVRSAETGVAVDL
jgi:UDP-N-acetylglucosamine 3-dehydrogenase